MAKTLSYNITPAPGAQLRTAKLPLDFISWSADSAYAKKQDQPDSCVYTNVNSGVDTPCEVTFGRQTIKNVYASTTVNPAYQSANTVGVKTLTKVSAVLTITDSANAAYRVDVPISATITLTTGTDPLVTDDVCMNFINYAMSTLFTEASATSAVTSQRLGALRRGSLVPTQK